MFSICPGLFQESQSRLFSLASEHGGLFHRKAEMFPARFSRLLESRAWLSLTIRFRKGKANPNRHFFTERISACFSVVRSFRAEIACLPPCANASENAPPSSHARQSGRRPWSNPTGTMRKRAPFVSRFVQKDENPLRVRF